MLVMAEGGCRLSHLGAGRKGEALFRLCSLGGMEQGSQEYGGNSSWGKKQVLPGCVGG